MSTFCTQTFQLVDQLGMYLLLFRLVELCMFQYIDLQVLGVFFALFSCQIFRMCMGILVLAFVRVFVPVNTLVFCLVTWFGMQQWFSHWMVSMGVNHDGMYHDKYSIRTLGSLISLYQIESSRVLRKGIMTFVIFSFTLWSELEQQKW